MSDSGSPTPNLGVNLGVTGVDSVVQGVQQANAAEQELDQARDERSRHEDERQRRYAEQQARRVMYMRAGVPSATLQQLDVEGVLEQSEAFLERMMGTVSDPQQRDAVRRKWSEFVTRHAQGRAGNMGAYTPDVVASAGLAGETYRDIGSERDEERWQATRLRYMTEEYGRYKKQEASLYGVPEAVVMQEENREKEKQIRNMQTLAQELRRVNPMLGQMAEGIGQLAGGTGGILTLAGMMGTLGVIMAQVGKTIAEFNTKMMEVGMSAASARTSIETGRLDAGARIEKIAEKWGYDPKTGRDVFESMRQKGWDEGEALNALERAEMVPTLAPTLQDIGVAGGGLPGQAGRRAGVSTIARQRAAQQAVKSAASAPQVLQAIEDAITNNKLTGEKASAFRRAAVAKYLGVSVDSEDFTRIALSTQFEMGDKPGDILASGFQEGGINIATDEVGYVESIRRKTMADPMTSINAMRGWGMRPAAELLRSYQSTKDAMGNVTIHEQNGGFYINFVPGGTTKTDSAARQAP